MSSLPIKTALKHLSAWSILIAFVALLTVIFSFLGTLFCAALGGMMMGATKASKALSLAFSVLCPGILMVTMKSQRTELADRQVMVLAILCVAAFWLLYVLSLLLVAYEKSGATSNSTVAAKNLATVNEAVVTPALRLAELEGKWLSEISGGVGQNQKRILEIRESAVALSTLGPDGRVCSRAQGRLKLEDVAATHVLAASNGVEIAAGI
jgi:NADH:ubiquinone oxidoreductase subunit K